MDTEAPMILSILQALSGSVWFGGRSYPAAASAYGGLAAGYFLAGLQSAIPCPVFSLKRAYRDVDVNIEVGLGERLFAVRPSIL